MWSTLVDALATSHHRSIRSWIHVTPGSGALLSAATLAFTCAVASRWSRPRRRSRRRRAPRGSTGATVHAVPVTADGRLDLDAMLAKAAGAGLVFVCNPNNPTGGSVPGTALAAFVERLKTVAPDARVLVDEAYFEYADEPGYATAVPLAVADRRVLVTRTFSKVFGMAGLRVGYAIAHPDTLAALAGARSGRHAEQRVAGRGGGGVRRHGAHRRREAHATAPSVSFTRERFEAAGYRVLPSAANFLMIDIRRDAGSFGGLLPPAADRGGAPLPAAHHLHAPDHRHAGRNGRGGAGDPGAARSRRPRPASSQGSIAQACPRAVDWDRRAADGSPDACRRSPAHAPLTRRSARAYSPTRPLAPAPRHVWPPVVTPP